MQIEAAGIDKRARQAAGPRYVEADPSFLLNDVIGFEGAENALVHFDLNCRVADAKMLV
jgi:hypothetical protein